MNNFPHSDFEFGLVENFNVEFDLMDENYYSVDKQLANFLDIDMLEVTPQTLFSVPQLEVEKSPVLDCSERLNEATTEELKEHNTFESEKKNSSI